MELNENVVIMTKDEYKEYIILKYNQEKLDEEAKKYENQLKARKQLLEKAIKANDLLDCLYRRNRMTGGYDTRREMTAFNNDYFGFDVPAKKFLQQNGFTPQMQIDYINEQWDKFEEEKRLKEQQENGEQNNEN